jgi:hypothetical protein
MSHGSDGEKHRATSSPTARGGSGQEPKRPYHVGVALGLTTSLYAASLLATARLQIATDRELIESRTPVEVAISALGDHHDWMADRLDEARAQYSIGSTDYETMRARLATLDEQLSRLGQAVDGVERIGDALPTSLDLSGPAVVTRKSSAGGKSSGGSTTRGTKAKAPAAPAAPAAPPPVTGGTTGASGAP